MHPDLTTEYYETNMTTRTATLFGQYYWHHDILMQCYYVCTPVVGVTIVIVVNS